MASTTLDFLTANGVDAVTARKVVQIMGTMMQLRPDKFLIASQLAVAAAAGSQGLRAPGPNRFYEGWPCKWFVPEMDSDASVMAVREMAASLAAMG